MDKYSEDFLQYHYNKEMKDTKGNYKGCLKLLKYIFEFKKGGQIVNKSQKKAFFFKEDLDAFEKYVEKCINEINSYKKTHFPYNPIEGEDTCKNCEFKKICLKKFEV